MADILSIKGVTSYHPSNPEIFDITKQNTFIFGLNGSGKSTISNFLYKTDEYPSCNISLDGNYTPIVYNQKFVDENFVNSSVQEGVFTLSKDNADLEAQIASKSKLREKLLDAFNETKKLIDAAESVQRKATDSAIEEVFKQKYIIEKTSLDPFLRSFKTPKRKFYEQVKMQKGVTDETIEALDHEYQELNQFDKNQPSKISLEPILEISPQDSVLLFEPVVGSSSSQLTDFINKVDNLGWVKVGQDNYLDDSQTTCPFCQKETIDEEFRSELAALFDKTYESTLRKVELVESSYRDNITKHIDSIKSAFANCSIYDSTQHNAEPLIELLEHAYTSNLDQIVSKIKNPTLSIKLADCTEQFKPLLTLAERINKSVQAIIDKAKQFKESEENIRSRMWDSVKFHTTPIFSLEKTLLDEKEEEIQKLRKQQEKIRRVGKKVAVRISSLRSKTSNIDDTIERINENLISLGITNFKIVASTNTEQKNFFMLSRGDSSDNTTPVFRSLSEGEKTLITFLYFIEKCNGSMSKDTDIAAKEKLIVIDDPISSLSQNYIYDIASLIQSKIIKGQKFKKVIVLTHSLFFFQELIKLSPNNAEQFDKKYTLYRLNKNQYSSVEPMTRNELKNDYQSLWQILKDVMNGKANPVVLPNVMRNITEYYFGFVHKKDKLSGILNDLADKEPEQGHKAFYRYINRGSHSDPTNIGLMVNINPQAYLERFEGIFVATQDREHYDCMMEQ
ncbi:TPA: AAA family ATPase [Photobacterium damselae]